MFSTLLLILVSFSCVIKTAEYPEAWPCQELGSCRCALCISIYMHVCVQTHTRLITLQTMDSNPPFQSGAEFWVHTAEKHEMLMPGCHVPQPGHGPLRRPPCGWPRFYVFLGSNLHTLQIKESCILQGRCVFFFPFLLLKLSLYCLFLKRKGLWTKLASL